MAARMLVPDPAQLTPLWAAWAMVEVMELVRSPVAALTSAAPTVTWRSAASWLMNWPLISLESHSATKVAL